MCMWFCSQDLVCIWPHFIYFLFIIFLKDFIFRERGREGERGRETSMCGCLSHAPNWGTRSATQACALTGNQTGDPFGSQAGAQFTEPHQPGLASF